MIKIGSITAENDKNEKSLNFLNRNPGFSFIFLETSDLTTIYISLSDLTVTKKSLILDKKNGPFFKWTVMDITL